MATKLFDRLKDTDRIVEFVDLYNRNNTLIEDEIGKLKDRTSILESNYNKKVDRKDLSEIINQEVKRVLDNDLNSDEVVGRRFVRYEEVQTMIRQILDLE